MTIFLYNLKRILRDKVNLIFMIVLPTVFIGIMMTSSFDFGLPKVGIIDRDNTKLTTTLISEMKEKSRIEILKDEDIKKNLIDKNMDYVIEIDKGFTEELIQGKNPQVNGYSIKEANVSGSIMFYLNSFLNSAKNIAETTKGDENKFYSALEKYKDGSFRAEYISLGDKDGKKVNTLQGLGFLVMGMLLLSTFGASIILKDKENKTFYRLFTSPITVKEYILQNILSFIVISVLQIALIFFITLVLFKGDLGPSIFNMFIVFLVFSLVCISLGIFVSSISKDIRQSGAILTFIITPMCMIGGCYWPRDIMGDLLLRISNFVPTTWVLKAAEKVIYGAGLGAVITEISIMLLFAIVFFLLGSWRKTDVAR